MKKFLSATTLLIICMYALAGFAQAPAPRQNRTADSLLKKFFVDFDLRSAGAEVETRLRRAPSDATALFSRMETAELQERPEVVLDSALRLCNLATSPEIQEIASNRILQHAANSRAFNAVLRRVKLASALHSSCAFNLKLALIAAATDGDPKVDLDSAANSAGLLTHWQIAGAFGHYDNVDFERQWPPETDQLAEVHYSAEQASAAELKGHSKKNATIAVERFWFRDGMIALPEYLSAPGIFYAASDLQTTSTQSQVEVLGAGPYEIFIDGKSKLLHDSRFATGSSRDSALVHLSAGHHRIMVKFTADATPLSLAIHPQSQSTQKDISSNPLKEYEQELLAYFHGDFELLARLLETAQHNDSGPAMYSRALLYSAIEEHSPRADAAWKAIATAQPGAYLARLKSLESVLEHGQNEEVRQEIKNILAQRPQSEMALQLAFHASRHNQPGTPELLGRLVDIHPSCTWLNEAIKLYSEMIEPDKAAQAEQKLAACAPESLQYARILSDSGRHGAAAAYLQQLVAKNPLHRGARHLLVKQLVLDNQLSAARLQAKQLHEISPNARSYEHLAVDPGSIQDGRSQRASGFLEGNEFYVPYRRDGIELVRKTAQRSFSGGPAVILLSDKIIFIQSNGAVSIYTHQITRPLNKDGISRYGEAALPRGADLLELRTIKSSGEIIEPELAQQKPTISMPALEAGDAIDEEYVTHYAGLEEMQTENSFTFGSLDAPILYSRMVLLSPAEDNVQIGEYAEPPQPLVGENNGMIVRIWERNNIAQTLAEPFLPSSYLLPTITLATAEKARDRLRDALIDATRIGVHVHETVFNLRTAADQSELEKIKHLYQFVTTRIESTGPDWANNTAEDTLLNGQGSRTATLVALAQASGLKADLLLARRVGQNCGKGDDFSCYREPLVRLWLNNGLVLDVDAESEDLPMGAISPSIASTDALLVPLSAEDQKKARIVALSTKAAIEKSIAEGDLTINDGNLSVNILVRLGPARAQEIRNLLRTAGGPERQAFFEQLAIRIFPGATAVTGTALHEKDPELPLELQLRYTVPQFITFTPKSGVGDIDQLAPALGLGSVYARAATRKFPLYIESLYFESTIFHLHLPDGMNVITMPADFSSKGEFGEYSVRFIRLARQIDIHREFHIPVQVIMPERYPAFSNFARQIDEAEQQRISLGAAGSPSGNFRNSLR